MSAPRARDLNLSCRCVAVDHDALRRGLVATTGLDWDAHLALRPHLFAEMAVFVSAGDLARMAALARAVHAAAACETYRRSVLDDAPAIARHRQAAAGVFLGYDFHLGEGGPQLIEINTNAGGGMLNALLARAARACCPEAGALPFPAEGVEDAFVAMFRAEWRAARGAAPLSRIAIVDEAPESQYLYPEFLLFRELFRRHGIDAVIAAPPELELRADGLYHAAGRVDLVYNRLTDFMLEEEANAALRQAYIAERVVLTPHPQAHALYADKRNLVLLSDAAFVSGLSISDADKACLLASIPRTVRVADQDAEALWRARRQWFFKPAAGYGSRAAYRGDKMTRRVFEEILAAGDYVAQALVPPSERHVEVAGEAVGLKLDLRNYAYEGEVQLVAARLYRGQTTNFRSPGGGFAPVFAVPDDAA